MENLPVFEIKKIKDGKVVKTYKIYINGNAEGFDDGDGCRHSISNHFPGLCRRVGISMRAFSPNMDVRDAVLPSSNISPT